MATPPLSIPGYAWDGKRYYKVFKSAAKHTPASQIRAGSSLPPPATSSSRTETEGRRKKRARKTLAKGKWRAAEAPQPNLWGLREMSVQSAWQGSVGTRERLHHDMRSLSLAQVTTVRSLYPDCLPLDDDVLHLSFDELSPSILRIGGSNGTIATGNLTRTADESAYFPNDEEGWRISWYFPSRITSLQTSGDRMLATCLGPPAQAVVATTSDSISLASVTLSPRKTSLWSSALSENLVALGCDKKVLVTSDASRPGGQMDGYNTGGNRGDGTVFALDIHENLFFAGTRKGRVHLFDSRSTRPSSTASSSSSPHIAKNELNLLLSSPVTHLRHIKEQPYLLLAAGMDGFLGVFDLRFPPRPSSRPFPASSSSGAAKPTSTPLLKLEGHVNSFTQGLGFDVWKDDFVAAAGQDSRLRLWSLRTGRLLSPAPSASSAAGATPTFSSTASPSALSAALSSLQTYTPSSTALSSLSTTFSTPDPHPSPFARLFSSPLRSISFSPIDPLRLGNKSYAEGLARRAEVDAPEEGRQERERELIRWGMPSLWLAEGGKVEGFVAG
ncbi:hypothetical protein JCM11251_006726 [Rhodosporidiobolus azoricus]